VIIEKWSQRLRRPLAIARRTPSVVRPEFAVRTASASYSLRLPKETMNKKPSAVMSGTVVTIIKSPFPNEPDKAEIHVIGADQLYREIRIDNSLTNEKGEEVSLKLGAQVEVTVEAKTESNNPNK
jgi:hypothetical protein